MKITIQASELLLSKEEMTKMIPQEKLNQLKGKGILTAYTIAQEGMSRPKVLGKGVEPLRWTKAVIHRLKEKIKSGLKFFIDHGENTNSHEDRKPVGEIITSFVKDIRGKLSNVIIGHFPNAEIVKDANICSMEADVYTDKDNVVGDINEVSGIALGNSNKDVPGFSGALRLNTVQCFGEPENTGTNNSGEGDNKMEIKFSDIKQAIKDKNIFPWQLFTEEEMKNDKIFGKVFDENSKFKSENERLTKEGEDLKKNSEEAIRKAQVADASKQLDGLMTEGYTDKQKQFIKNQFDPEVQKDLSDEGLKKFLEKGKKDFSETAKIFGETETPDSTLGDGQKSAEGLTPEEEALKAIGV